MIRSACVHCGASLWRGIDYDIGQALVDVAPLSVAEENELILASLQEDGWRRHRISFDVLTIDGRDAPVIEARRAWKAPRPRGYVVISHRCGKPPARRLPFFPEGSGVIEAGTPDDPPFFPEGGNFSPVEDAGAFFPPVAELFSPDGPDLAALARIAPDAIPVGTCTLCGLRVQRKGARLCNTCAPFAHGRVYDSSNTPVIGWCEVGRHRRRTALRNTSGQWDCGRHNTPARNTPAPNTLQPARHSGA